MPYQYKFRKYVIMITKREEDFLLYQSEFIATHQHDLMDDLHHAHRLFKVMFPDNDSTWTYDRYNIFTLTAPSSAFYRVYKELRNLIRSELGDTRELWIQSWVNYHTDDQLLQRHHHDFEYHGYISIDPQTTKTVFEDVEIINKPGQIYFGKGHRYHHVEAIEPFDGIRTTIGFDIHTTPQSEFIKDWMEKPYTNNGFIPLI